MCQKRNSVNCIQLIVPFRIDSCMRSKVGDLITRGHNTVACCCGHGKYPETIVCIGKNGAYELNTKIKIPRIKRFYRKDSEGFYYIPEVIQLEIERVRKELDHLINGAEFIRECEEFNRKIGGRFPTID